MDVSTANPKLVLCGQFRLIGPDGEEIAIRAAKSRGLLALLALSPLGRRARGWLQDKLWSDRGRDQAAASLRQALSQLRLELGAYGPLLTTTRELVTLDLQRIDIIDRPADGAREQFLEGLDLRDPEFEAWLRAERAARAPGSAGRDAPGVAYLAAKGLPRAVYMVAQGAPRSAERLFEDIFIDCLERSLRESLSVEVYRRPPLPAETDPMFMVVEVFSLTPHNHGLRVHIEEGRRRRALWTGTRTAPTNGAPPVDHQEMLALVYEATEALADALLLDRVRARGQLDAALMARLAIRKIFMLTPAEMIQADALLAEAFAQDRHPQFLAWRIQLRVIQRMERHVELGPTAGTAIEALMAEALALDPHNSMVLAAVANAKLLVEDNLVAGAEYARASLRINAANPFAWDCLSIALLMTGALEEAHTHQMRAGSIAARFPIRHFWDMGGCLTSIATGRHDEALRLARSAHALAPSFRPPLRYLTALHAARGEAEAALGFAGRLRQLEPDFSLDRMMSDDSYPVAALRHSGLLNAHALRDLGGQPLPRGTQR